jgi:hypothetical protein
MYAQVPFMAFGKGKGKNKVVVNFPFYIENNIHMAGLPYFNMY